MHIFTRLREKFPKLAAEEGFSFSAHTTIGCGGVAAAAVYPSCSGEAEQALAYLGREKIPYFVLGRGANVLPSDGYFDGVAVCTSKMNALGEAGGEIVAGAGVTGSKLLAFARAHAIGGFEPFFGIPMSLGGAAAMNAGVKERHLSDVAVGAVGVENGKLRAFSHADCRFAEKDSIFLQGVAVTEVRLRAERCDPAEIGRNLLKYAQRRRALPAGRSMGCTFVNPPAASAGAIIDACGLKGARRGGAHVSEQHANFIINDGGTAKDVAELIDYVRGEVFKKTGILLREEIRRLNF